MNVVNNIYTLNKDKTNHFPIALLQDNFNGENVWIAISKYNTLIKDEGIWDNCNRLEYIKEHLNNYISITKITWKLGTFPNYISFGIDPEEAIKNL